MISFSRLAPAVALCVACALPGPLAAQSGSPFSPAVIVNDVAISNYELQQRQLILRLFRTPGDLREVARQQLIDERLQLFAASQFGVEPDEEAIRGGMEEFAGRANLSADAFIGQLATQGVSEATFRDFVKAGLAWRELVRGLFGPQVSVSESEIDRALSVTEVTGGAEVFISEIILPARNPAELQRAEQLALQLSNSIGSFGGFAAAARQYSASPSRAQGGQVPQAVPLENLPPALQQEFLTLAPGEVSSPVPIPNAVAVFQLRELRDTGKPMPDAVEVEYARYLIPGIGPEAQAEAARIDAEADACADLYGINLGQPDERLTVETTTVASLPADIALELAKLDRGETSSALTRGGATLLLMLCTRRPQRENEVDRTVVRNRLAERKAAALAAVYLAELRAEAIIREP